MSVLTFLVFVVIFSIIVNQCLYINTQTLAVTDCSNRCSDENNWFDIHREDSYIEFWGSSLTCFILGVYQLAASVIIYAQNLKSAKPTN